MTANTLEERKRYINQIKASFKEPGRSGKYQDVSMSGAAHGEESEKAEFGFFKLKALVAIGLFAAFVYCDQNQLQISRYTTADFYEMIQETVPVEKLIQAIEAQLPSF